MNEKTYSIKINGLTESINAVDSLNKELDKLEQRMNALSSAKVTTATGGGSSSRGNVSALSEEERVQKEINKLKQQGAQLDAKIAASQDDIFKRVEATKELYKETLADQKAIAAQERLTADAYSNTMMGMKQQLADLKAVIQTTDLGDSEGIKKMTEQANELTNKLKEMEEAYGQFGRNVGNYKDSLKGIEVTIAGVTREFSSSREAMRTLREELRSLSATERGQTQYAKELRREYNRLKSAIDDATKSSKFMDEAMDMMQSFTALQQVSQGFSTFFGIDNSEMEKQIARLVALQNVLQGIEKIQQQMDSGEGIGKWLSRGSEAVDNLVMKLTGAQKRMGMLVTETRAGSIAVQRLSAGLKVLGGAGIAGAVMLATTAVGKLMEDFKRWKTGGYEAGTATDVLNKKLEAFRDQIEFIKRIDLDRFFRGLIDYETYTKELTEDLINQINILTNSLGKLEKRDFSKGSGSILGGLTVGYGKDEEEALARAEARFDSLAKKIDKLESDESGSAFVKWVKDLVGLGGDLDRLTREFQDLGEGLSQNILVEMRTLMSQAKTEMRELGGLTDETKSKIKALANSLRYDETTTSVLANVDKFSKKGQYYVNQINMIKDAFMELGDSLGNAEIDAGKITQLNIDAMKDGLAKRRAQIELNRKRELADAGNNAELLKAINAKYNRELLEAEKAHGKEMAAALADLAELRIQAMREGWEKQKKELEHERDERIRTIREDEKLVAERTAAAQALYSKKILEARRDWAYEMVEVYRNMYQEIEQLNRQTMQREVGTAEQSITNRQSSRKSGQWRDNIDINNPNNIQDRRDYYNEILKIDLDAARKQQEIRQESLDKELEYNKKEEQLRHDRVADAKTISTVMAEVSKIPNPSDSDYANIEKKLQKQLAGMRGELVDSYNEGKLEFKNFVRLIEREQEAHNASMNALQKEYNVQTEANTQQGLDESKQLYAQYYNDLLSTIRTQQDDVSRIMSQQPVKDTAGWGVVNVGKTRQNYNMSEDAYKNIAADITRTKEQLKKDLQGDKISAEDFFMKNAELDAMKKSVDDSLKEIKEKQKMLIADFLQSIQQYIQAGMDSFNTIMQAVWDAQDVQFDKEQEQLDKLNEQLDKKLDEQQEIVEKHKDAIDSIEDELATARGDRRQHLIDQLNAEMEAQRAAAAQEKKIQKEKEAAQKKQDELEKKRKKAQYQRDLLQAIVNGAMAVTFAAMNAWPVPAIPMMALAAATTAAQVAIMSANKPYAKGGLLEGKSHAQGGIPIPGTGIEVEGKEYVIRKKSTAPNIDILDYINRSERKLSLDDFIDFYGGKVKKNVASMSPGRKFADGGSLPTLSNNYEFDDRLLTAFEDYSNRPVQVAVVDINDRQAQVRNVQVMAGLTE